MKKNRNKKVYDYKRHSTEFNNVEIPSDDIRYYGLHKEGGRIKVDIKRLKKLHLSSFKDEFLDAASQIPRHTTYFVPRKLHEEDYVINQFRNKLTSLSKQWYEIKGAFDNVRSPKDVYDSARTDAICEGVLDVDEATEHAMMAGMRRYPVYQKMWISQCAQFIHQMATELDALMLRKCVYLGYARKDVTRGSMHDYLNGTMKGKAQIEKLEGYENIYSKFFMVWNMIKHNSEDLFEKVKKNYPDMLLVDTYRNGEMSQYYLKIGNDYIEKMLNDLLIFYEDLCEKFFDEDRNESKWNYDDYFLDNVKEEIQSISNTLGY